MIEVQISEVDVLRKQVEVLGNSIGQIQVELAQATAVVALLNAQLEQARKKVQELSGVDNDTGTD